MLLLSGPFCRPVAGAVSQAALVTPVHKLSLVITANPPTAQVQPGWVSSSKHGREGQLQRLRPPVYAYMAVALPPVRHVLVRLMKNPSATCWHALADMYVRVIRSGCGSSGAQSYVRYPLEAEPIRLFNSQGPMNKQVRVRPLGLPIRRQRLTVMSNRPNCRHNTHNKVCPPVNNERYWVTDQQEPIVR